MFIQDLVALLDILAAAPVPMEHVWVLLKTASVMLTAIIMATAVLILKRCVPLLIRKVNNITDNSLEYIPHTHFMAS